MTPHPVRPVNHDARAERRDALVAREITTFDAPPDPRAAPVGFLLMDVALNHGGHRVTVPITDGVGSQSGFTNK